MESIDAYAPPKSPVTEIELEPGPPGIPLTFKIMLIAFLALALLGLVTSANKAGLVWLGVMAIAAWKTLQGSRAASRVLGGLFVLNAVVTLVSTFPAFRQGTAGGVMVLAMAIYLGVLAAYIFFHPAMQAVFRKAERKKWSGG